MAAAVNAAVDDTAGDAAAAAYDGPVDGAVVN